jgi:hypothetical protein
MFPLLSLGPCQVILARRSTSMAPDGVADEPAALAGEIDPERDAAGKVGVGAVDQALADVQGGERSRIEQRGAAAKADLRERAPSRTRTEKVRGLISA